MTGEIKISKEGLENIIENKKDRRQNTKTDEENRREKVSKESIQLVSIQKKNKDRGGGQTE